MAEEYQEQAPAQEQAPEIAPAQQGAEEEPRERRRTTTPGEGDSGTGGGVSQSEDVISSVGRLNVRRESTSKAGGYGRGGSNFKIASDQPGGKVAAGVYFGCTDPKAANYNPLATLDDGSCKEEEMTKPDPKVISGFSKYLQYPEKKLKNFNFGLFNYLQGFDSLNPDVQTPTGVVLDTAVEGEQSSTGNNNTFRAGVEEPRSNSNTTFTDSEDNEFATEMDKILNLYIQASYIIASQKQCGDCSKQLEKDYLNAVALIDALMIVSSDVGALYDWKESTDKLNTTLTNIVNRKCKDC